MQLLTFDEAQQVSGGLPSAGEVANGAFVGAIGGALTGARSGTVFGVVGGAVFGAALGAAYVVIRGTFMK